MAIPLARLLATGVMLLSDDEKNAIGGFEEITIPVSSSAIRTISWRTGDVITVEFNQRGTYSYEGSKELFLAFAAAPSKGTFFNQNFQVRR